MRQDAFVPNSSSTDTLFVLQLNVNVINSAAKLRSQEDE